MRKLFSVLALFAAAPLMAFNPQPEPPGFGFIGIVSSQTARLNISYSAPPEPEHGFPPGPCTGLLQLRFYGQSGNVVAEKTTRVALGGSESLDFTTSFHDIAPTSRSAIRAQASWVTVPPGPCRGAVIGHVEVFSNATGETQFVLQGTTMVSAQGN